MRRTDRDEWGAGLVEYALLIGLVAMVALGAVSFVGDSTSDKLSVMGVALERDGASGTTMASGSTTTTAATPTTVTPTTVTPTTVTPTTVTPTTVTPTTVTPTTAAPTTTRPCNPNSNSQNCR